MGKNAKGGMDCWWRGENTKKTYLSLYYQTEKAKHR